MRKLFRTLEHIPVLAPAGAIIPLQADPEDQNPYPVEMLIFVFAGADGDFPYMKMMAKRWIISLESIEKLKCVFLGKRVHHLQLRLNIQQRNGLDSGTML